MRLLSFLSEIERTLVRGTSNNGAAAWETTRMVNFQHGLARLTMKPRSKTDRPSQDGTIFLQAFTLANGSLCLKASLGWNGSDAVPVIVVYSTPTLNWRHEAAGIAAAWLKGPPAHSAFSSATIAPFAAAAAAG
jgi:hypothetical protein